MAIRFSTLSTGRFYTPNPGIIPGIFTWYSLVKPHRVAGRITSFKIFHHNIGNRTRKLSERRALSPSNAGYKFVLYFIFVSRDYAATLFEKSERDTVWIVLGFVAMAVAIRIQRPDMQSSCCYSPHTTQTHTHIKNTQRHNLQLQQMGR